MSEQVRTRSACNAAQLAAAAAAAVTAPTPYLTEAPAAVGAAGVKQAVDLDAQHGQHAHAVPPDIQTDQAGRLLN